MVNCEGSQLKIVDEGGVMLYGAAYYPEHRDPSRWGYDLDNMAEMNVNALRIGEFAWKRFEPREGIYDFDWMDTFIEKAIEREIGLLMCPSLRTVPAWLVEADPTVLIENQDRVRLEFGSRYTFCINHPFLREKALALARALAEHYGSNEAILGWHLDNEYGDEPDCHCHVCKDKWQDWLRNRYKIVTNLNKAWGTVFWGLEFDNFNQIPTPKITKAPRNPGHVQAWRQFRSDCTIEIVGLHAGAIRPYIRNKPVTTNNQPLWNHRTDYYALAEHLDICGTNYYPLYGEDCQAIAFGLATCRSYKKAGFQLHELRSGTHAIPSLSGNTPQPGEIERLTMHVIANGADAIFYFRWKACPFGAEQEHGSITDYDGYPTRVYEECKVIGEKLKRLSGLLADTEIRSDVAIFYDFPTRWMLETEADSPWRGPESLYMDQCKKLYASVRRLGINCDAVGRDGDFEAYKLIVVPILSSVDEDLVYRLRQYVERGGTLVWHPLSGIKNRDAEIYPQRLHPDLQKLLGVSVAEFATAGPNEKHTMAWQDKRYAAKLFMDLPVLNGAESIGEYLDSWFAGKSAIVQNKIGKGKVLYVTTFPEEDFYEELFTSLCKEVGIKPILDVNFSDAVEVTERRGDTGTRLVFLINNSSREETIMFDEVVEDLWSDKMISGRVALKPFGVRVLRFITSDAKG